MLDPITLIVGAVTTALVEGAKRLSFVPLDPKNKKAIRTVAAVLTFGGTFAYAWADGALTGAQFTQYLGVVADGLVSYFVAYLGYKSMLNGSKKTEAEYTG